MTALLLAASFLLSPMQTTLPAPSSAPPTASPAAPVEDPKVTALARSIYSQMRAGKIDPALMTDQMNKALTPEALAQQKPIFDQLGDPVQLTLESARTQAGGNTYVYLARFATAQLHVTLSLNKDGKVAGYALAL